MTNTSNTVDANTSWYKQFWPWFLIALPSSAVVASIITIIIAVDNADSLVADDYYKKALQINRDLSKIELAKNLGLTAKLTLNEDKLRLSFNAKDKSVKLPPALDLFFIHPAQASKDISIVLIQSGSVVVDVQGASQSYISRTELKNVNALRNTAWNIQLLPTDKKWQLTGKVKKSVIEIPLYAD